MNINEVKNTARMIRPFVFGVATSVFIINSEWLLALMIAFLYLVALLADL